MSVYEPKPSEVFVHRAIPYEWVDRPLWQAYALLNGGHLKVSNCLLAAFRERLRDRSTRIRFTRNRLGRWHCYWTRGGIKYEFYAPGRSAKSYFQNLLYHGYVKEIERAHDP